MHIELEAVPITEFVPLAKDADKRALLVGIFGHLTVFIFDPYTIALSKLDRGFDTDLEDIIFLIQSDLVAIDQLEDYVRLIVPMANQYDLDLGEMHRHLQVIRRSL